MIPDRFTGVVVHAAPAVAGRAAARAAAGCLVVAAALSAAAYAGRPVLVLAAVLAAALLAMGWTSLLELPSPRGTTTVVAASGALTAVAVGMAHDEPRLEWLAPALAAAVVGEFVHQLGRRDGRPRMVESVCGSVSGVAVVASLACVVAVPGSPVGPAGVLAWAVPVALAVALQALPLPARLAVPAGAVVAALAGALLGELLGPNPLAGAVAGAAGAAVAMMLHRLLCVLPRAGQTPGWLALAVAPVAASGMVGYLALRLVAG